MIAGQVLRLELSRFQQLFEQLLTAAVTGSGRMAGIQAASRHKWVKQESKVDTRLMSSLQSFDR